MCLLCPELWEFIQQKLTDIPMYEYTHIYMHWHIQLCDLVLWSKFVHDFQLICNIWLKMTIKAVWEHLPRPLITEQRHCLYNGLEMNNFMWKYNMRCNALKLLLPPNLNIEYWGVLDNKSQNDSLGEFIFFLTQQFSIHQILGSAVPRRKILHCNFPTDQASTLILSIPFTWENRLWRAKPRNNQPGYPVEKIGVYLFSLFGDWL